jgi:hypothetical protein
MGLEYFTSERFIHDNLIDQAEAGLRGIYRHWRDERNVDPFLVTWPSEPVPDDKGIPITDACVLSLPEDRKEWQKLILDAIQRTKAYGILLVEQRDGDVRAILETKHGAKCWTLPIVRSGDLLVLKKPEVTTNRENLGLLWQSKVGQA